jgi:hypothetical protein
MVWFLISLFLNWKQIPAVAAAAYYFEVFKNNFNKQIGF